MHGLDTLANKNCHFPSFSTNVGFTNQDCYYPKLYKAFLFEYDAMKCVHNLNLKRTNPTDDIFSYEGILDFDVPNVIAVVAPSNDELSLNNKAWFDVEKNRQIALEYMRNTNRDICGNMCLGIAKLEDIL